MLFIHFLYSWFYWLLTFAIWKKAKQKEVLGKQSLNVFCSCLTPTVSYSGRTNAGTSTDTGSYSGRTNAGTSTDTGSSSRRKDATETDLYQYDQQRLEEHTDNLISIQEDVHRKTLFYLLTNYNSDRIYIFESASCIYIIQQNRVATPFKGKLFCKYMWVCLLMDQICCK